MYSLDWPRAHGIPHSIGSIKLFPEDFQVNEFFEGQFTGEGEHIVLRIEKKGLTTEEVVKSLGKLINKPTSLISYAGLKDKQALTTQWLSIHAPGEIIPGIQTLAAPGWRVLECTRHHKKLRPGFLSGNQFIITLRNITDREDLIQRIELIKLKGVPNYFGEQRFGREGANLIKAEAMLVQGRKIKDRFLKGIYCSAARSWIYNLILAKRVLDSSWDKPLDGDVMQLSGSNSIFVNELALDEKLLKRIADKDISPASPLPGKCKNLTKEQRLAVINQVYEEWDPWLNGLEKYGLEEAWRANILQATKFEYNIKNDNAELAFILSPGAYATTVLRELISY